MKRVFFYEQIKMWTLSEKLSTHRSPKFKKFIGSLWDGVNFTLIRPCSTVICICSKNVVNDTPVFWQLLSCACTTSILPVATPQKLNVGKRLGGHQTDVPCCMVLRSERRDKKRQGERGAFLIKVTVFRSSCYVCWTPASQAGHHQLNGNRE